MKNISKALLLGAALTVSAASAKAVPTTIVPFDVLVTANYDLTTSTDLSAFVGTTGSGFYDWSQGSTPGVTGWSLTIDFASGSETFSSGVVGPIVTVDATNDITAVSFEVKDDDPSTAGFDDLIAVAGIVGFEVLSIVPEVGTTAATLNVGLYSASSTSPAAVPLPATAGLSLGAFALMGFVARRRKAAASA